MCDDVKFIEYDTGIWKGIGDTFDKGGRHFAVFNNAFPSITMILTENISGNF